MTTPRELAREELARIEMARTAIARGTAWVVVLAFLGSIAAVPLVQLAYELRAGEAAQEAWSLLADLPVAVRSTFAARRGEGTAWFPAIAAANREAMRLLHAFEDAVEDEAVLGRSLRPPAQYVLSAWLGAGNEQVYVGRDGWLFYRPEVEYLTTPGFLTPERMEAMSDAFRRAQGALSLSRDALSEWEAPPQPDARTAILHFKRQLDARGIALVVVPTPVKPMIHPEKLSPRYDGREEALQNPSFEAFVRDLEREGVLLVDVAGELAAARQEGRPVYLAADTHWRPEIVEAVAERLAAVLATRVGISRGGTRYSAVRLEVANAGDIAAMLDLPPGRTLYPPERVYVRRIFELDGAPWRPSRSAEILILGDSFTNIYSLGSIGWGEGAGLAEQLSVALGRPVDRIVQNDNGAYATRALLARALAGSSSPTADDRRETGGRPDRLTGKRAVVYQFAVRELAVGDWRLIDLPAPEAR